MPEGLIFPALPPRPPDSQGNGEVSFCICPKTARYGGKFNGVFIAFSHIQCIHIIQCKPFVFDMFITLHQRLVRNLTRIYENHILSLMIWICGFMIDTPQSTAE